MEGYRMTLAGFGKRSEALFANGIDRCVINYYYYTIALCVTEIVMVNGC